jgi:hypothetical protein
MAMSDIITFKAGSNALRIIREEGFNQDRISVLAGAAGGPKWLILGGIDRMLFGTIFQKRKRPLFMIGSSIGSWRFAALARKNQLEAIDRFERAYLDQFYTRVPTADEVTEVSQRILDSYLEDEAVAEVLSHRYVRLNMLSVRSKNLFKAGSRGGLAAGMAIASLCNMMSRRTMGLFFERILFYDSRDIPPFYRIKGFPIRQVPLTPENLKPAVMSSGSIPLVMNGVTDIPGAPDGVYRDGGMLDYQLDIPFDPDPGNIVLYPHYSDSIIPGWLDKHLPWRRARGKNMHNVLIVSPSKSFIAALPYGKIPDRNDFMRFKGRDAERLDYWNKTIEAGKILSEEFFEAVTSGKIRKMVVEY